MEVEVFVNGQPYQCVNLRSGTHTIKIAAVEKTPIYDETGYMSCQIMRDVTCKQYTTDVERGPHGFIARLDSDEVELDDGVLYLR